MTSVNSSPPTPPFKVSADHTQGLIPDTFTQLLRRPLRAAGMVRSIHLDSIHGATGKRAPDAVKDGYIGWDGDLGRTKFVIGERTNSNRSAARPYLARPLGKC